MSLIGIKKLNQTVYKLVLSSIILALLLLSSCSTDNEPLYSEDNEGWSQRSTAEKEAYLPLDLEEWDLIDERSNEGIFSINLKKYVNDHQIQLVVTGLPVIMDKEELAAETKRIMRSSLYNIESLEDAYTKEYDNLEVIITNAKAGEQEPVLTRAAAFSQHGRTFIFITLAKIESFDVALSELEKLLSSINLD